MELMDFEQLKFLILLCWLTVKALIKESEKICGQELSAPANHDTATHQSGPSQDFRYTNRDRSCQDFVPLIPNFDDIRPPSQRLTDFECNVIAWLLPGTTDTYNSISNPCNRIQSSRCTLVGCTI